MSKNNDEVYYAVGRGRKIGIYSSWNDCKLQIEGVNNAKYKKFFSLGEAEEFVDFWKNYSSPSKNYRESSPLIKAEEDCLEVSPNHIYEDYRLQEPSTSNQEEQEHKQKQKSEASPQKSAESPEKFHFTPSKESVDQKDVNIMALNMRLDSFERRFDVCLKEVGGIVSEMTNIKKEIKEIKEALKSSFSSSPRSKSNYSYSPKNKNGMMQTTLSFENSNEKKSCSGFSSPSTSYSSKADNNADPPKWERRNLKRKLSKNISEESEKSHDGGSGNEDILSKIKVEAVDYSFFNVDADEFVEVYTDGACHMNGKNGAKAGIGIWFGDSHPLNVAEPLQGSPTNNSAEIQAARVAIELAAKAGISKLKIFTDSEFLMNCATKWIHRWKKNGWTLITGGQVKNREELEKLDRAASKIEVRWEKVEGHAGVKGNEMADRLANEGASKYKR